MDYLLKISILPFLFSVLVSFFSTPLVIRFAEKIKIIDDPRKHKHPKVIHTYPVPRGGGISPFLAIIFSSFLFLPPQDPHIVAISIGAIIITVLGILDDKYDLNPYLRLLIQTLACFFPIAAGVKIDFLTNPFGGIINLAEPKIPLSFLGVERQISILSDVFAFFWIIFIMNILNMGAKGVDGQLPGVVAIAGITIALLSLRFSADITQWPIIILASSVGGAYLGFLPWNFYPQKIMPGFSGSTLAGYYLAILSILSTTKVGTLILVLGIPLVDTSYTIARRILQGKSPVWGDRGHLHHKLLDAGVSKKGVAFLYWFFSALLGVLALSLNASYKLYTIIGIALFVGGLLLWLTYKPRK